MYRYVRKGTGVYHVMLWASKVVGIQKELRKQCALIKLVFLISKVSVFNFDN